MDDSLANAIILREQGLLTESNGMLLRLVQASPDDSLLNYHCAWSCDALGLEREAIPYYLRALHLGLPDEEMQGAFLGLGSTYRALGMYQDSRDVLERATEAFPENYALKVFLSMTLYNLRENSSAMAILLQALAETSSDARIKRYKRAINFYADKLDEIW